MRELIRSLATVAAFTAATVLVSTSYYGLSCLFGSLGMVLGSFGGGRQGMPGWWFASQMFLAGAIMQLGLDQIIRLGQW